MRFVALLLFAVAAPAYAEMSVATFAAKAEALKAKGILALASSDVALLRKEMAVVTEAYRDDIKSARAAGRPPHSCPPPKAAMNSDDLIAHYKTLPPKTGIKAGFYSMMKKTYPCPA